MHLYCRQPPPDGLTCDLLPHQIVGLAWLKKRESAGPVEPKEPEEELTDLPAPSTIGRDDPKKQSKKKKKASGSGEKFGGILADDMGLGKTIQMSESCSTSDEFQIAVRASRLS